MVRRQQRKARPTLTPGKSKHEGLVNGGVDYDSGLESGGDETKGMRKKKSGRKNRVTRLGGGRQEEGVLYTVKLVVSVLFGMLMMQHDNTNLHLQIILLCCYIPFY